MYLILTNKNDNPSLVNDKQGEALKFDTYQEAEAIAATWKDTIIISTNAPLVDISSNDYTLNHKSFGVDFSCFNFGGELDRIELEDTEVSD